MPRRHHVLKSPGRPPLSSKRDLYIRLMRQGMSNTDACLAVGVHRRTGYRWSRGRTVRTRDGRDRVYDAITSPPVPISARFLSEEERLLIADGLMLGQSIRSLARELDRSPSTISREIQRNRNPGTGRYHPHRAQQCAEGRRPRPKPRKLVPSSDLREFVQARLEERWSPEQIAKSLPKLFPDRAEMRVAHETIYQAIYVQGRGQLRRELASALRSGRAQRKPHRRSDQRSPRFGPSMVMISDRPPEVADRAVPGHWEGDLITGEKNQSAIGTLVERTTRFVMLLHLPNGHGAEDVRDALVEATVGLPAHLARSLTWDQGSEMARHTEFTVATNVPVYFCNPASPWQRGSNENTNGLLRQYFPKGADLNVYDSARLDEVAAQLNARPRKTLDWDTPAQRLDSLLANPN